MRLRTFLLLIPLFVLPLIVVGLTIEETFNYDSGGRLIRERGANGEVIAEYDYGYLDKVVAVRRGGRQVKFYYNAAGMLVGKRLSS